MSDLKPCPFCGGTADMIPGGPLRDVVECNVCEAKIPERGGGGASAADQWNRRAHLVMPRDFAYEDFRATGNPAAAAIVSDELASVARGEDLDREVTEADLGSSGFRKSSVYQSTWTVAHHGDEGQILEVEYTERNGWRWTTDFCSAIYSLPTLREFRALCTLFGIGEKK